MNALQLLSKLFAIECNYRVHSSNRASDTDPSNLTRAMVVTGYTQSSTQPGATPARRLVPLKVQLRAQAGAPIRQTRRRLPDQTQRRPTLRHPALRHPARMPRTSWWKWTAPKSLWQGPPQRKRKAPPL